MNKFFELKDQLFTRLCAYAIQRYMGKYFQERVVTKQLKIELRNGKLSLEKVILDVKALNDLSEEQNWPVEFVDGFIENLKISLPWLKILSEPTNIEINGLKLTVQPKQRNENAASMFESMWNSMTSSLKIAEEFAKADSKNVDDATPPGGLEQFAGAIDSFFQRVKVKVLNTIIQIEHVPKESQRGVGLVINIDLLEYSDEAGESEPVQEEVLENEAEDEKKEFVVQTFTTKNFNIAGVTFSTIEFPSKDRTFSRNIRYRNEDSEDEGSDCSESSSEQNSENESIETTEKEESEKDRQMILCGKFASRLAIKVHMRQGEDASSPKVSIEVNLGHLMIFLSPRQVHVLLELASGLASPDLEDHSNVPQKQKLVEKPMSAADYQRVENELQLQMRPFEFQAAGLQATAGWSGIPAEDSDGDENFYPLSTANEMYDSTMSGFSSSLESSISSSAPSTTFTEQTGRSRRQINKGHNLDVDPSAEISHFQVQLASLALIILHEDLLNLNAEQNTFVPSSVVQMQRIATDFFNSVNHFGFLSSAESNFEKSCSTFNNCCKLNHLRLYALSINIEVNEKKTTNSFSITGELEASRLQIVECLYESAKKDLEIVPILKFEEYFSSNPQFFVNFKHIRKSKHSFKNNCAKSEINIRLGKCSVEFDITIIDRVTALLHPSIICNTEQRAQNTFATEIPLLGIQNEEFLTDIKVETPYLNVKLRFPIPDFRPSHDLNRTPWWKRNVRPDHLILRCYDVNFNTSSLSSQTNSEYTFQCRGSNVYYNETERGSPIFIAKIGREDAYPSSLQDVSNHPKITVKLFPEERELELEEMDDVMTQSAFSPGYFKQPDNGPFTAKKVVHESNTPHDRKPEEEEELVIPGDKEEIENFKKSSMESTRIQIDIFLSVVQMQLLSRHIYELIYNRINNDLLLWESTAPRRKQKNSQFFDMINETQEKFSACRSGMGYDSESDSEEASESENRLFYSTCERPRSAASSHFTLAPSQFSTRQCNLILNLQIIQGTLSCNTPVRDATTNNIIPGQMGDLLLNVENTTVFLVNGYKGDHDLGYLCVQVERAELLHCEMMPSTGVRFNLAKGELGHHLQPTIYKTTKGLLSEVKHDTAIRDMLTVACKIETKHETHHAKTIRIALGISQATLRHRMCVEPNSWISQILDFFSVNDYPIPGYNSKEALTELHIHIWDCAIDYRPLYLPLRSILTLGCFSMTSHLSEKSNASTLRFIAEECNLFLSDKAPPKNGVPSMIPVDIRRDYVNVIYLGLFELSLRTTDKNSKNYPHIDMRASNDCVHIYTCSDSGKALTQLITYIATDGDSKLSETNISNADSAYSSPKHQQIEHEQLVAVEQAQDISKLTKSQHVQVNQLLVDALEESEPEEDSEDEDETTGARLFFFPDENQFVSTNPFHKPLPQVVRELGDLSLQNKDEDSDDDFYFVDEETGLGLFPKNGVPEIKWLTNDPVRVEENHFFVPVAKKDLLKTPDDFPIPKYKYTLCEMNIIWHMYGGNDFKNKTDRKNEKKKEKNIEFADSKSYNAVSYSGKDEIKFQETFFSPKKPEMSWKIRGGVNRDHKVLMELELNKVKFQHEVYPETAYQASRQVLLISELEIRDLLASSEFNKFLYQYTCEAKPKQSQGQMIVIKAVHIRPDKNLSAEECCLRLSLLPLRFNVDQDSLKFLVNFFTELGQTTSEDEEVMSRSSSKQNTPTHRPPIMTINTEKEEKKKEEWQPAADDENLIVLDPNHFVEKYEPPEYTPCIENANQPVFFRSVIFAPDVLIKIDYQGKGIDMADSSLAGLLFALVMGLAQLNCSEIRLKRISYRHGLLGVDKLLTFLLQEWLTDIKKNQLSSLLSGVGPINSLVQLFQGIKDLFWMPIEQYQKDGRIVRGIQRGANSFTTSTAMAALELTTRIIHLIQVTAETAYDMLSPGPSVKKICRPKGKKRRYNQPQDIREGVANAIWLVKEGIGETAGTIVDVASHEHQQKGYSGAVGGVLRQIPPTIIKPIIIASEATSNVLGGMKYQLIPDARNEANQKWKTKDE